MLEFIKYSLKARNAHAIHSPFVYELYTETILSQRYFYSFENIESLRESFLHNHNKIQVDDLGAGSKKLKGEFRKISDIARTSVSNVKKGRLLFRLSEKFKPAYLLELGTSLGISGAYLASGNPSGLLTTLEGCSTTAQLAAETFHGLGLSNVQLLNHHFDISLHRVLERLPKVDLLYVDGNHTYRSTVRYFELCLKKAQSDSLFIFDDIYWSEEMKRAWEHIKQHPKVAFTIDLYQLGLVFFREKQAKQHFILQF